MNSISEWRKRWLPTCGSEGETADDKAVIQKPATELFCFLCRLYTHTGISIKYLCTTRLEVWPLQETYTSAAPSIPLSSSGDCGGDVCFGPLSWNDGPAAGISYFWAIWFPLIAHHFKVTAQDNELYTFIQCEDARQKKD